MRQTRSTPSWAFNVPHSAPRRRGRPFKDGQDAVSEDRVLELAFENFAQRGYEGTTVRDLAKQLGVSHNLLNVRFGSKADLWRSAVDARISVVGGPVSVSFDIPGLDDTGRLDELVHRFCLWAATNPDFVSLIHTEGLNSTWRLDYLVAAHIEPFRRRLAILLANIATHRPIREISCYALMAILIQGVGFYFASAPLRRRIDAGSAVSTESNDYAVKVFAEFILAGLLPGEAG